MYYLYKIIVSFLTTSSNANEFENFVKVAQQEAKEERYIVTFKDTKSNKKGAKESASLDAK
jgi:hypothetical protein